MKPLKDGEKLSKDPKIGQFKEGNRGVFMYDVVIIGGGIVGCAIARELSMYDISVALIEKEEDVAAGGATKANSAIIHAGYDPMPGTLKARLNVKGNEMYGELAEKLDIPFKRIGSLVLAFNDEERRVLEELYRRGKNNGVPELRIVEKGELREMEPNVSDDAIAALYAPTAGIICPYEATIAFYENAKENGVDFIFDSKVISIEKQNHFIIETTSGEIKASNVINAAGIYADDISRMVGAEDFKLIPRRGEYVLLDKSQGSIVKHVIFQTPTKYGKGVLVSPTVDGNLIVGPNAMDIDDKEENITTSKGLDEVVESARRSVPAFDLRERITNFAGIRAVPAEGDFIISHSSKVSGFINVAGIESPGLTAAPAIAVEVREILSKTGLRLVKKDNFIDTRTVVRFRELNFQERMELIKKEPKYGKIICRCETVTEGEIVDAIRRGARSIDAIKRRTRAGMGRCQGGFCSPRVTEILSKELRIPMEKVTKNGDSSYMLVSKVKETLRGEENA